MPYMKCPSCKELFGNRRVVFEQLRSQIIDSDLDEGIKKTKVEELVRSMNFKRYCCVPRFIADTPLVLIVK
jgi:hypothetical protein